METVISYMEKRLKEYNETIVKEHETPTVSNDTYYEILAARNELIHLLDYTKKVGPISK